METLNPAQVDNALTWLREQWPQEPLDAEEYSLALGHLYPGELILALERLPPLPRPSPEAILEAAQNERPANKPPSQEFIRSVIDQARKDLARVR